MDIAFLPDDRRNLKIFDLKKHDTINNNEDLWLATIIEGTYPFGDDFLYLSHPKTKYETIYMLDGNWRRNLKEIVKKALRRELDELKTQNVEPGIYENYLEDINFTQIPKEYLNDSQFLKEKITFYYDRFIDVSSIPEEYYVPEFIFGYLKETQNTVEKPGEIESPYIKFSEMLRKYQLNKLKEYQFKDNKEALKKPEYIMPDKNDLGLTEPIDPRKEIVVDTSNITVKEPQEINIRRLNQLQNKVQQVLESGDITRNREKIQKQVDNLIKKMNKCISYYQSPYSGEYRNIIIPLDNIDAFEFLITLDAGPFLVKRRIIVPADMTFTDFDKLLGHLFRWVGFPYHLSEFIFPPLNEPESKEASEVLIWQEDDLQKDNSLGPVDRMYINMHNPFEKAKKNDIKKYRLKDYFPKFKTAQYRYDFGDNWYHTIELTDIYQKEELDIELPYLLYSSGVAPMEDIGGTPAFDSLFEMDLSLDEDQYTQMAIEWNKEEDNFLLAPCSLKELFEEENK